MKKVTVYCDRCKRDVSDVKNNNRNNYSGKNFFAEIANLFPNYEINQFTISGGSQKIDLCCECSKKLFNWIWKYAEGENDEVHN